VYIYLHYDDLETNGCYRIQLAANALSDGNGVVWVGRFDELERGYPLGIAIITNANDYIQIVSKNCKYRE
jgi:hypothetical protein